MVHAAVYRKAADPAVSTKFRGVLYYLNDQFARRCYDEGGGFPGFARPFIWLREHLAEYGDQIRRGLPGACLRLACHVEPGHRLVEGFSLDWRTVFEACVENTVHHLYGEVEIVKTFFPFLRLHGEFRGIPRGVCNWRRIGLPAPLLAAATFRLAIPLGLWLGVLAIARPGFAGLTYLRLGLLAGLFPVESARFRSGAFPLRTYLGIGAPFFLFSEKFSGDCAY